MSYGQMAGGGPTVDTILSEPNCKPGGVVAGKVHLRGGSGPVEVRHVTLALMPRMHNGYGGESAGPEVYRGALTRGFRLDAGGQRDLAFSIPLPYELPFTTVLGHELPGFTIGMCTEVDVAGQPDPGDVDPISVEPLESQQWVLASIARLGFQITNVTFESSKLRGVSQQLPFHQEIHLNPPTSHQGRIDKIGLSFIASPRGMSFVLRAEDRDTPQDESFGVFKVPHAEAAETDWNAKIGQWLEAAVALPRSSRPRSSPGAPTPPRPARHHYRRLAPRHRSHPHHPHPRARPRRPTAAQANTATPSTHPRPPPQANSQPPWPLPPPHHPQATAASPAPSRHPLRTPHRHTPPCPPTAPRTALPPRDPADPRHTAPHPHSTAPHPRHTAHRPCSTAHRPHQRQAARPPTRLRRPTAGRPHPPRTTRPRRTGTRARRRCTSTTPRPATTGTAATA
ncbi:sporulation protein [Actinomadura madurae]|uniref:sporulation protein n=1 Tax=Actinomadura madurae TaxID=1993 RepID=UPI0024E26FBA|nr:sporulation protein [Actinomadura madurae]